MNRLMFGLVILAGCVASVAGTIQAEEKKATAEAFPLMDIKADVPRFVAIVDALGQGTPNLDVALELIEAELPRPFPASGVPFEEDVRARWKQEFGRLAELEAKFESVDFVGCQSISSAARTLVFIGHGHGGPIQFRFRVFRYQDKWRISNLSYQGSWDEIETDTSFTRFQNPVSYLLGTEPVVHTEAE